MTYWLAGPFTSPELRWDAWDQRRQVREQVTFPKRPFPGWVLAFGEGPAAYFFPVPSSRAREAIVFFFGSVSCQHCWPRLIMAQQRKKTYRLTVVKTFAPTSFLEAWRILKTLLTSSLRSRSNKNQSSKFIHLGISPPVYYTHFDSCSKTAIQCKQLTGWNFNLRASNGKGPNEGKLLTKHSIACIIYCKFYPNFIGE